MQRAGYPTMYQSKTNSATSFLACEQGAERNPIRSMSENTGHVHRAKHPVGTCAPSKARREHPEERWEGFSRVEVPGMWAHGRFHFFSCKMLW